jgi:hypothetical protein
MVRPSPPKPPTTLHPPPSTHHTPPTTQNRLTPHTGLGPRSPVLGPRFSVPVLGPHHSNNNEVYAHELVRAFDAFPPLNNPWNRAVFDKNVAQNIGVYTTQETKLEALSELLASLLKNQVAISEGFFTVGAEAFNPKEDPAEPEEQIDILCEQLKNFTDHDDGSISGKSAGNEDDGAGRTHSAPDPFPLHSTPLHSTPLHSTPIPTQRRFLLHSTPLHSTPARKKAAMALLLASSWSVKCKAAARRGRREDFWTPG